jgi:hypothetical protein
LWLSKELPHQKFVTAEVSFWQVTGANLKQDIGYVGTDWTFAFINTSRAAQLKLFSAQPPIMPKILAGTYLNTSAAPVSAAVGSPKYFSPKASVAICRLLCTSILQAWSQFGLKKMADLDLLTSCLDPL